MNTPAEAYRTLMRARGAEWRNRLRAGWRGRKFRLLVVGVFSLLFWTALFAIFVEAFQFLERSILREYSGQLIQFLFSSFFFALTVMLILSNGILAYSTLFSGRETEFLMSRPVPMGSLFLYKMGETLSFSSWAFVFLGLPMLAAYAKVHDLGAGFVVISLGLFLIYMILPAALGVLGAALVANFFPRSMRSLFKLLAVAVGVVAAWIGVQFLTIPSAFGISAEVRMAAELLQAAGMTRNPMWPSYWLTEAVLGVGDGRWERVAMFAGVIFANGLLLVTVLGGTAGLWLRRGWHLGAAGRRRRRYGAPAVDRALLGGMFFLDPQVRWIVWKDVKSFLRDPVQMAQFLIFFGLLGIYFVNLKAFAQDSRDDLLWKNLIAQLNLLATALTLSTFASRFIFPQVSLEGRRFWVLGMAPMAREKILIGKMTLCFLSSLAISESLIFVSSLMLDIPRPVAILQAVSLAGICLGISGLAVGLGTIYPNFGEDNPSKIVSGFGGTLNLVLMLAFVVSVLLIQMLPSAALLRGTMTGPDFTRACLGSMAGVAVVSLVAGLIPLTTAMKRIRLLEI